MKQRMKHWLARGVAIGLLMLGLPAQAGVERTVDGGRIAGSVEDGVAAFLGIPYATPPVGALRWQPPQPVPAWPGVREALDYGPACPQPEDRLFGFTPKTQSEDCLTLNVWAPEDAQGAPVMVWLHGGAHRIGAASLPFYDGRPLASRGVVVVTVNYRLGYLGYIAHPALAASGSEGNFGLLDQLQALRWVQANIAAFGGDPAKVTLFGESAGGADVLYLMTNGQARGLFRAAIVQSGGGWGKPKTVEAMRKAVSETLDKGGIDAEIDAAGLRALDARALVKAQAVDRDLGFGPYLDGRSVREAPYAVFARGAQLPVPMVIGSNDAEGSLLKLREPGVRDWLFTHLPPFSGWYPQADADRHRRLLFRDIVFGAPARWIARQHQARAPSWLYRYEYVRAAQRGKVDGAGHAAEIAFVFDTLDSTPQLAETATAEDRAVARALADCWAGFARDLRPACSGWQPVTATSNQLWRIGTSSRMTDDPDAAALDGVEHWFGPGGRLGP